MGRRFRAEAINFIKDGGVPSSLIRSDPELLSAVMLIIKEDAPNDLIMSDPALYRLLRRRVTDLRIAGWLDNSFTRKIK